MIKKSKRFVSALLILLLGTGCTAFSMKDKEVQKDQAVTTQENEPEMPKTMEEFEAFFKSQGTTRHDAAMDEAARVEKEHDYETGLKAKEMILYGEAAYQAQLAEEKGKEIPNIMLLYYDYCFQLKETTLEKELKKLVSKLEKLLPAEEVKTIAEKIHSREVSLEGGFAKASPNLNLDPETTKALAIAHGTLGWYSLNDYDLSATLMARALFLEDDKPYEPAEPLRQIIMKTKAYEDLKVKTLPEGSEEEGSFTLLTNREEADATFGIHTFKAVFHPEEILLEDVFRLEPNDEGVVQDPAGELKGKMDEKEVTDPVAVFNHLEKEGLFHTYPVHIRLSR